MLLLIGSYTPLLVVETLRLKFWVIPESCNPYQEVLTKTVQKRFSSI